jgi:thiol-disulfide isomerase/thioredoxin
VHDFGVNSPLPSILRRSLAGLFCMLVCLANARAQEAAPAPAPDAAPAPAAEAEPPRIGSAETNAALQGIVEKLTAKAQEGKRDAESFKDEMAALEALYQSVKDAKDENLALVLAVKASVYLQVLDDPTSALAELQRIKEGIPGHPMLESVKQMEADVRSEIERREKTAKLVGSAAPELTFTWATREGLAKLSDLKGKVVVLDFWATWCGPCVATFPKIRELAAHYKDKPVEIIGVTSLQGAVMGLEAKPISTEGDPKKEMELLGQYAKKKEMTWTVALSEQEVFNPDYGIQGIPHVVIIDADGKVRHSGLHPGSPLEEKIALIDPLLAEIGKK